MSNNSALLVTGGAGFIGSNFIAYYLKKYPGRQLVNIDKLTYAGNLENLMEAENMDHYHFVHGDISDEALVGDVFNEFDIEGVVHFAAESHVDKSIADSKPFILTNVLGTGVLLEAARRDWSEKGALSQRRFHHISTDEVYGSLEGEGKFTENTPYKPRNPYSATKAGANMLVKSYYTTYGMNVVLSSSSNNYGPRQNDEKLIPTIMRKALSLEPIPIYGDGMNVRDWLYVGDHCRAIDTVFHNGEAGETYNVGGGNEQTNLELTEFICRQLDAINPQLLREKDLTSFSELITFVDDRPGHDLRYAVDDTKLRNHLDWAPEISYVDGLKKTVNWYVNKWKEVVK
ncbi:dTDP-glucose 4,6-dehydratase [Halobacillus shinanisalinarum]|uniref:dTDP-glucose 4,6-dehydratase n=1 Tax=Halobacillus shinanisalinarum TaxID=2932258 RepID=A0ABY4GYL5_9BACI|nr:dTDP-glucose 4,6-dehydratase [Halobacillus shinanisalinarum]UOQ92969.1 dTDP-glucose 4,6-dehydratase [Halobacillus shinanisalinarum]